MFRRGYGIADLDGRSNSNDGTIRWLAGLSIKLIFEASVALFFQSDRSCRAGAVLSTLKLHRTPPTHSAFVQYGSQSAQYCSGNSGCDEVAGPNGLGGMSGVRLILSTGNGVLSRTIYLFALIVGQTTSVIRTGNRRWRYATDTELEDRIWSNTLPRVEPALSDPVTVDCPNECLCHNVDNKRIAELLKQFNDGSHWTDAVYVLECRHRTVTEKVLREEFQLQTDRQWAHQAQEHDRLLYVGVTQAAATRLKQHVSAQGQGANFTQIFPASRLLSIDWYPSTSQAYRAEPITANVLDEATGDGVYVSQPG